MTDFAELFPFLASDRADVRKMAASGVAQLSKDNKELFRFVSDEEHNKEHVSKLTDLIDPRLPATAIPTLGDALLAVVNLSVDLACCEVLTKRQVPIKLLRLFETLQVKGDEIPNGAVYSELVLMALNNLTATCVSACEQVLELSDPDLAGYSFGRLKTHFDRCEEMEEKLDEKQKEIEGSKPSAAAPAAVSKTTEEQEKQQQQQEEQEKKEAAAAQAKKSTASFRRWILQIALNLARIKDGARIFLEDDDWCPLPAELITHNNVHTRALAMQLVRNLSVFGEATHEKLVDDAKIVSRLVHVICVKETDSTLLHGWIDIITALLQTEPGMRGMDQVNAKRLLVAAVKESSEMHRQITQAKSAAAEQQQAQLPQNDSSSATPPPPPVRTVPLPWDVIKRINEEILPFLDDIKEVFVTGPGAGEDDDE